MGFLSQLMVNGLMYVKSDNLPSRAIARLSLRLLLPESLDASLSSYPVKETFAMTVSTSC